MKSAIDRSIFAISRMIEPELLQPVSKRAKRDTNELGGALLHTIRGLQRLIEQAPLIIAEHCFEVDSLAIGNAWSLSTCDWAQHSRGKRLEVDGIGTTERDGSLDHILEFTNISRKSRM